MNDYEDKRLHCYMDYIYGSSAHTFLYVCDTEKYVIKVHINNFRIFNTFFRFIIYGICVG